MKVVYFIDNLLRGGTQRALTYIVKGLSELGYEQAVIDMINIGDTEIITALKKCDVTIRGIGKWKIVTGMELISVAKWLKQQNFDAAVTMLFYSDQIGIRLSKIAGIPKIIASNSIQQ